MALLGTQLNVRVRSASVIGLYVSYVTPIFLRITTGRDKLQHGPFSLGKWYMPIGIVAVAWVSFITVLLMFPPEVNPSADTMSAWIASYAELMLTLYARIQIMRS